MCGICGCSKENQEMHGHSHANHEHFIAVEQDILGQNQQFALANQRYLRDKNILALNVMSSPGSGKTTLLAKTIADLKREMEIAVVVGDQQTDSDANILQASGGHARQINTGKVCHLDAHRVGHALDDLALAPFSMVFIENIGNLVCPAMFDLGEAFKIVILSVAEGDNKPLKYPDMFRCADLLLITKMDLLAHVNFDLDQCIEYARRIKPSVEILTLSAQSGEGLTHWYAWLKQKRMEMHG